MKYNSIGEQLIAKAQELDPNYKPDKFNDMSEAIDVILNNSGSGDGKSVPPTLNLVDFENGVVRTTITEEEKDNLEKGLYNQVIYIEGMEEDMFMPSKIFSDKSLGFNIFVQLHANENAQSITSLAMYSLNIGEKDTSGNYPITIEKQADVSVGSGGASIPTLVTKRSYIDANDTIYSDADIELIKKQENNFINLPVGDNNNVVNTLCFVVKNQIDSSGNSYILTAVGGWAVALTSLLSSAYAFIVWNANITTKKLAMSQFTCLSYDNTALYVQDNKIFLTDSLTTQDPVNILHTFYTFDTINGKPIIHNGTAVNSYTFTEDKTISLFGEHSILVPKNSTDTNILPLPADASTSTYVLKAINGTVQWVKES